MSLRFYNTLSRQKETFVPIQDGVVKMYTCGPTVYDYAHIGNHRTFIFEDILRRYLEFKGYKVTQVMNLTDVDDNTIKRSRERGISLTDLTDEFKKAFHADLETLNAQPASAYPSATSYVEQMIQMIQELESRDYAYKAEDGSVYFNIAKYDSYGRLAHLNPEDMISGERVAEDSYEKEGVRDFALWKGYKEEDGDVYWDSPWGKGRPGWHIECSVMSTELLGPHFDIHCGGVDNIFPHHENEIAQSVCATDAAFVNYWLHSEYLLVDNKKMSKSLNNFYTLRDLIEQGYRADTIRWMLITTHYRQKLNFSVSRLDAAKKAIQRLRDFQEKLENHTATGKERGEDAVSTAFKSFSEAMDDDLNISGGLAAVFDLVRWGNRAMDEGRLSSEGAKAVLDLLMQVNHVLGILDMEPAEASDLDEAYIETLIAARAEARKNRDFAASDAIRDELVEKGIELIDSPDGTTWKLK